VYIKSNYNYNTMADPSENGSKEKKNECDIIYKIDDNPPWYFAILLAFQV